MCMLRPILKKYMSDGATKSYVVNDLTCTHSLVSFQWSALWPASAPPDWKLPTCRQFLARRSIPEMVPQQVERFLVAASADQGWPRLTKAVLQPTKAAAMCTIPCVETHPPFPTPPFLLAQKLPSNWLHQLMTCSQSQTMSKGVIGGWSDNYNMQPTVCKFPALTATSTVA